MNKLALPALLIIVSIGLFVFHVDPTYKDIKDLTAINGQYNEARDQSKELRKVRDSLLEMYNSFTAEDLDRIKKLVPDNIDNVRLVMNIDNIASKYGMTIKNVKVNQLDDKSGNQIILNTSDYDSVTLNFSVTASYEDFISFISDLKDSLRLVDIVSLDLSAAGTDTTAYKYDLGIKTYWLK